MRRTLTALAVVATAASLAPAAVDAQLSDQCFIMDGRGTPETVVERPSPKNSIEFTLGGETGVLCWDAPSMNGREIFGALQPYGELWRLGANEATAIHLPFGGDIGGVEVEPGSYSLYAIPGEESFEIFVNTNYQRWGIGIDASVRSTEIGSFTRSVTTLDEPVEQMRFRFEAHGENMGHLVMEWENTRVDIPVHKGM
jgi:hypothetical protein